VSEKNDPHLKVAKEISDKLSTLIQLTVGGLLKDAKNQRERIALLSTAGVPPVRIAEMLGTTSNTVNKELSVIRKAKKNDKNDSNSAPEDIEIEVKVENGNVQGDQP